MVLLFGSTPSEAQTACPGSADTLFVVAPGATQIQGCFDPGSEYDARDVDNSPIVTGYNVLFFRDGDNVATATPLRPPVSIGKPTRSPDGNVRFTLPVDFTQGTRFRISIQPFGTIAGTGTPRTFARSEASNPFGMARQGQGAATGRPIVGPLP